MSAATANEIKRGDVLEPCSVPGCPGQLVFESVTGPMLGAACNQPGCQEWLGIKRVDAERRLAAVVGESDDERFWWQR
jgi:hypothetical protein